MSLWEDHEPTPPRKKRTLVNPKTKKSSKKEKKDASCLFTRGYSDVRKKVEKGSRFIKSCYNCDYFYQASGDKEEVCQNSDVLKYDMVVTDCNIFCNRWKISHRTQSVKGMFKKKG